MEIPVDGGSIDSVTLYQRIAEVKREITVAGGDGLRTLAFCGFPTNLEEQSLSVRVSADGKPLCIEELNVSVKHRGPGCPQRDQGLMSKIRNLQQKLQITQRDIEAAERSDVLINDFARSMLTAPEASTPPCLDINTFSKGVDTLLDYQTQRSRKNAERICTLAMDRQDTYAELQALYAELREILPGVDLTEDFKGFQESKNHIEDRLWARVPSKTVSVVVRLESCKSVTVSFTYRVPSCGWTPSFDLRIGTDKEETTATLEYASHIRQTTGEDWKDVQVALSSAKLSAPDRPATLPTQTVGLKVKGARAALLESDMLDSSSRCEKNSMRLMCAAPPPGAQHRESDVLGCSTVTVERRLDVPSSSDSKKITVARIALSQPSVVVVGSPGVGSGLFAHISGLSAAAFPTPSGPCSIFIDSAFVCKTKLPQVISGGTVSAFAGSVDNVHMITKGEISSVLKSTGFVNKSSGVQKATAFTLINTRPTSVKVVTLHALPKSVDDRVKVSLLNPPVETTINEQSDAEAIAIVQGMENKVVHNKVTHTVLWCRVLAPGERVEQLFAYTFEYPLTEELALHNL